jgi:succinoglycan biosynthesis transport protein ExoP
MQPNAGAGSGLDTDPQRPTWILPGRPPGGLPALAAVVRDRWWLALLVAAAVVAAGIGLSRLQSPSYKAEALLIVSPSSAPAISECGLDVINGGGGLTRDVETLARLVKTPAVARRAAVILKSQANPSTLLKSVDAAPVGQSYLVSITGSASKPGAAAALANAFARSTVNGRAARFNRQVRSCRLRLETSLATTTNGPVKTAMQARIAELQAMEGGGDPTVGIDTLATSPTASSGPSFLIILLASLAAGIALGLGCAALAAALDRRINSERQLMQAYDLPIVAQVPSRHGQRPVSAARSSQLAPWAAEAYRRVRQRILASSGTSPDVRSVLMTSASRREGRTTAAINTSVALIETGLRVLLVDLDLRHPNIAGVLGIASPVGVHDVLERGVSLADAASSVPVHSGRLDVLIALPTDADLVDQVAPAAVRELIAQAQDLGYDVIVFDSPQLGNVSDALSIATEVDDVFLVVWRKRTAKAALAALARTCADHGISPRGFVVMGAKSPRAQGRVPR